MNTRNWWVSLGWGALVVAISGCAAAGGAKNTSSTSAGTTTAQTTSTKGDVVTTPSGLQYEDLVVGTGAEASRGRTVVVHYTGWLTDGTRFQSSKDSNRPYQFQVGAGEVIAGWEEGISTMKAGGTRKLTIPPNLAYGHAGRPPVIPQDATLVFEVELLEVK